MTSLFEYAPAPESRSIVDIKPSYGLFIDGEFVDGTGESFKTVNPATEEVLTEVASGSAADVDRAVAAARTAFDEGEWPRLSPEERIEAVQAEIASARQSLEADRRHLPERMRAVRGS